jgi:alcohol dehydrogenase class IV
VAELGPELRRLGARRILLVTNRSLLAREGPVGTVRQQMDSADVAVTVTISQHAPMTEVDAAARLAGEQNVDGVLSFGGGSAIDAAKLLAVRLADSNGHAEHSLPHVAIPTTLSVAELAAGAGFTNEAGDKAGLRDPRLLPACVIYDPGLTLATPMELWLSTGIRALDHALEGFLAGGEHPFSDVMSLEAARRLFDSLPRAKADPGNLEVRTENQLAAWFSFTLPGPSAGGLSHVMGKQIGARHAIPHGVTSCLLLPHVLRYVATRQPERYARLREAMGGDPADSVYALIASLELPQHIAAYGIGEPELRRAARELAGQHAAADLLAVYLAAL